jgi:hypothetical protein
VASCADLNALVLENCYDNPSPSCVENVSLNGSLYAQGLYAPLKGCTIGCGTECGPAKDSECLEQCAIKACPLDWLSCLSNASTGDQTCGQMLDCANAYDGKWASIIAFCFAEASAEAQQDLAVYLSCVSEPVTESCIDEAAACVGSTGNATCQETVACTEGCGDDVCYYDCIEAATPAAQSQLAGLADCLTQQCGFCGGDEACEQQCLFSQCGGAAAACFLGG